MYLTQHIRLLCGLYLLPLPTCVWPVVVTCPRKLQVLHESHLRHRYPAWWKKVLHLGAVPESALWAVRVIVVHDVTPCQPAGPPPERPHTHNHVITAGKRQQVHDGVIGRDLTAPDAHIRRLF